MLLILSNDKQSAETVCNIFYYLGIISYSEIYNSVKPEDVRQSTAVLMLHFGTPESLAFSRNAQESFADKPLFACSEINPYGTEISNMNIQVFPNTLSFPEIASILITDNRCRLGKYEAAGVCADRVNLHATVDGKELQLTKTELMIVRYLCATYPRRQRAERIRAFCWRSAKMPEISNVRTHISVINSKAKKAIGRHLISSGIKCGYVLMD